MGLMLSFWPARVGGGRCVCSGRGGIALQ